MIFRKWYTPILLTLIAFGTLAPAHYSDNKFGSLLKERITKLTPDKKELVWIFFKDKGPDVSLSKSNTFQLTEKALQRRAKVRNPGHLIDEKDLPVSRQYVDAVKATGMSIRNTSNWLNAVSLWATRQQLEELSGLGFVQRIDLVARFPMKRDAVERESTALLDILRKPSLQVIDSGFYGYSYSQLKQLKVPEVHQLGFYGQGVTIAVFDNGFRLLSHEALGMNIIDTYDFVDKKVSVVPVHPADAGSPPDWGGHGVNTLSVLGGFEKDKLIGPAYKSGFILARTENDSSETPFEEDNWIAAMEWAEGLGADIISSSLGYLEMTGSRSYDWTWMNGDSTVITKAANIGVGMGLVIVNSAGNEYSNISHNTLGAPADGDSVIAVGAVDASGIRAAFSSVGPTTLGRIKPDVMARGYAVAAASSTNSTGYVLVDGTSFSCPLTAGVCALILCAHPGLSPAQVRWALKMTANNADNPDNLYGYGVIDAFAAANYFGITGVPDTTQVPPQDILYQNTSNPFSDITTIRYDVANAGNVRIVIYNVLGQQVKKLVDRYHAVQSGYTAVWNGKDAHGNAVSSGMYFYRLEVNKFSKTKKMLLIR